MGAVHRDAAGGVNPHGGVRGVGLRLRVAPVFFQGPPITDSFLPEPAGSGAQASSVVLDTEWLCPNLGNNILRRPSYVY